MITNITLFVMKNFAELSKNKFIYGFGYKKLRGIKLEVITKFATDEADPNLTFS